MPFQFQWLCELFEELQQTRHKSGFTLARARNHEHTIIYDWYQRFDRKIERSGPSAVAFLSCLLPERRPDRVYSLQPNRLSQIFGRALGLGSCRALQLNQWRNRDGADFPTCVELTLQDCENDEPAPGKEVTLEEIDEALELIAAHSPSSSPEIRAKITNTTPIELLTPILRRLKSNESKWFARMLLKSYAPIQIPEYQALHGFHFMLPNLLVIQSSFHAAIAVLAKEEIRRLPARPIKEYETALQPLLAEHVQPRLNVMVKRQPYHKARSIKNCCALAGGRQMSIERKYDGEYCQIHIDMSQGFDCIKIFSKSGKDSTTDRIRLHGAIKDALRIGRDSCRFRNRCIIEGELLVWSMSKKQIQPFHKIRRHVKHGGRNIGTAQDSPARHDDKLMIAFYDILVLDDLMLLSKAHSVRRRYLKMVLQTSGLEGRAILAERKTIDFRGRHADQKLRKVFATAITQRWEGLVLKGSNDPYYNWGHQLHGIKLKKDYITGLGDVADLCIVGGRRDPHAEQLIGVGTLRWTMFYVGAVTNMEAVRRFGTKPHIKIIDVLTHHSIPKTELLDMNKLGKILQVDYAAQIAEYDVEIGHRHMENPTDLFKRPFIVEIMGAGFEKLSNSSFFTLRFPRKIDRKVKLHTDRTILDTMSFSELQIMAERSLVVPVDQDSQDDAYWIEQLIRTDGRQPNSQSISQATSSNRTPKSPSAISLSPINPRGSTMSPIYVRPDTEEPETQNSNSTNLNTSQDVAVQSNDRSRSLPGTSAEATSNKSSQKRRSNTFAESNQGNLSNKRRRLQPLIDEKQEDPSEANDLAVQSKSQYVQELHPAEQHIDSSETKSLTQLYTQGSSCPAEPCIAVGTGIGSASVDENAGGSPPTPDSTLVMRQILSVYHRQCNLPLESSPAQTTTGRQCFALSVNEMFALNCPQTTSFLPTPLPTPLTSSPAVDKSPTVGKSITTISRTNRHTLKQKSRPYQGQSQQGLVNQNMKPTTSTCHQTMIALPSSVSEMSAVHLSTIQRPAQTKKSNPPPILVLTPNQNVLSLLPSVEATFTFSKTLFVRNLVASAKENDSVPATDKSQYHIMLVNTHNPESLGNDFKYIINILEENPELHATTSDLDTALAMLDDRVLVFDHRVLEHEDIIEAGMGLEVLQKLDYREGRGFDATLFCGVARFVRAADAAGEEVSARGEGAGWAMRLNLEYSFAWLPYEDTGSDNSIGI